MYHAGDDPNKIYFSNCKDDGVDFNVCVFPSDAHVMFTREKVDRWTTFEFG